MYLYCNMTRVTNASTSPSENNQQEHNSEYLPQLGSNPLGITVQGGLYHTEWGEPEGPPRLTELFGGQKFNDV